MLHLLREGQSDVSSLDQLKLSSKLDGYKINPGVSFFCPHCKIERRIRQGLRPGVAKHWIQVGLTTAVATLALWKWFAWKGLVLFIPFWVIFETFYRLRLRKILRCNQCGFDPILYLSDVKAARQEIETFWKRKFEEKGIIEKPSLTDTPP